MSLHLVVLIMQQKINDAMSKFKSGSVGGGCSVHVYRLKMQQIRNIVFILGETPKMNVQFCSTFIVLICMDDSAKGKVQFSLLHT